MFVSVNWAQGSTGHQLDDGGVAKWRLLDLSICDLFGTRADCNTSDGHGRRASRASRVLQQRNSLCSRPHCVPSGLASFGMNADEGSLPATQSQLFEGRDNVRTIAPSHPATSQTYKCSLLDEALRAVQGLPTFRELILMLSKVSSILWLSLKCTNV